MTIKLGLIVLGALLIYGSWKDLSIRALIFGDNSTSGNHPIGGSTAASTASSSSNTSLPPGQSPSGQSSPAGPGAAATGSSANQIGEANSVPSALIDRGLFVAGLG